MGILTQLTQVTGSLIKKGICEIIFWQKPYIWLAVQHFVSTLRSVYPKLCKTVDSEATHHISMVAIVCTAILAERGP